jgi:hypothetical protein
VAVTRARTSSVAAPARAIGAIALLGALAWALTGRGLVNYDTLYAVVWGRDIAHGTAPDYDVTLAPTPHPLATLGGVVLAPLSTAADRGVHGEAATTVVLVGAFGALGALGWVVYRLGSEWFNPAAGLLAAAIVLTRRPVLDFGSRAYVDIPYVALVLGALLVETRRPRAGAPVLALLAVAGLLRPEAWLFSLVYLAWMWRAPRSRSPALVVLALAAPLLWALGDLAVTGDPLHSLLGTRDNARTLERITGLGEVPLTAPRRLGEILREPVLFGAAGGGLLALAWLRDRARLGAAAGVVAIVAFCVLAAAGLPILGRYLLLPAAVLAIFCGDARPARGLHAGAGGPDPRAAPRPRAPGHDPGRPRGACAHPARGDPSVVRAGHGSQPPPGSGARAVARQRPDGDRLSAGAAPADRDVGDPGEPAGRARLRARPARPRQADRAAAARHAAGGRGRVVARLHPLLTGPGAPASPAKSPVQSWPQPA